MPITIDPKPDMKIEESNGWSEQIFVNPCLAETLSIKSIGLAKTIRNKSTSEFYKVYNCPTTTHPMKIPYGKLSKEKTRDYLTIHTEDTNHLVKVFLNKKPQTPGSIKYSKIKDWAKNITQPTIPKAERITATKEIFVKS